MYDAGEYTMKCTVYHRPTTESKAGISVTEPIYPSAEGKQLSISQKAAAN